MWVAGAKVKGNMDFILKELWLYILTDQFLYIELMYEKEGSSQRTFFFYLSLGFLQGGAAFAAVFAKC